MRTPDSRSTYDRGSRKPNFDNVSRGSSYPQYKEQFEVLNAKLDKILRLLNPEKSIEEPKVVVKPQVKDAAKSVENVMSVKKKKRAKKQVSTETDIATEAPKE